jgi:hypothetical protein
MHLFRMPMLRELCVAYPLEMEKAKDSDECNGRVCRPSKAICQCDNILLRNNCARSERDSEWLKKPLVEQSSTTAP